jgi:hypothetical protein
MSNDVLDFVGLDCEKLIGERLPDLLSDFSGGMDELVLSVYLSSELMVTDTQTVDGPGVL